MGNNTTAPLQACSVVLTRPVRQSERLARLIREAGGEPILFPALAIEPPLDTAPVKTLLARVVEFDIVVFISPNAVEQAFHLAEQPLPAGPQIAAIGEGTGSALRERGVADVLTPKGAGDTEALLAQPQLSQLSGARVLIVRGEGGRELLAEQLRARGAQVTYAECYRRTRPPAHATQLLDRWDRGEVHAVSAMSGETLNNFWHIVGERGQALFRCTPLFVPHANIAERAARLGLTEVAITPPGEDGLLRGLGAWFALQRR